MKETKEARMGMIAVLALMLVSMKRRLPATRKLSSGITTLTLAGIVLLVAAGSASANGVCVWGSIPAGEYYECGDTVTQSCTFNASMICDDDTMPGLYIGADNVVIDGAGYAMTGSRSAAACALSVFGAAPPSEAVPAKHSGIVNGANMQSYDNVVIKNLEITNFCTGIVLGDGSFAYDVDNNTVTECYIHDCGDSSRTTHGIHVVYANNCNMTKNEITNIQGTGIPGGCSGGGNGIFMYGSVDAGRGWYNDITCNYLHGNEKSGFFMKHQCMHCTISYNNATENTEGGIMPNCKQSNFNAIEYNNMSGNAIWGMYCNGNANMIRYNTAHDNGNIGIELGGMAGVGNGGDNILVNNSLCGNVQDLVVAMIANNTGDSNTCGAGPAGWCDWDCADPVSTYFDFDDDGYYSQDDCPCTNQAGGKCACCNPGVFHSTHADLLKGVGICRLSGDIHDDPNDCDNTIQGAQKPDYIVTAVNIVWLDDAQYNVAYIVKNDGDAVAGTSSTIIATGYLTIKNGTPALSIGESSSGVVGPFTCGGPAENLTDSITVCADCDDEIDETLEGNNCNSVPTVTCKWPDYRIIDKYETWVDEAAKTYNITYLICNNGTRDATANTRTQIEIDGTSNPTGNGPDIVPPIPKGSCLLRVFRNDEVFTMPDSYDVIKLTANMGPSSGRITELDTTNNAITNTFFGAVSVSLDPLVSTVSANPGTTTVNITLNNVADYGSGTIHVYYDNTVIEVDSCGAGDSTSVIGHDQGNGHWKISASNTVGLTGDNIRYATVTYKPAIGSSPGDCSYINLAVEKLYDRSYTNLATMTTNGTMCIKESDAPAVTAPAANPPVILNNTPQMRARVLGTDVTNLSVHVTDATNVNSVYVDLTPIGGVVEKMTGPDGQKVGDWWYETHANHSSLTLYCLDVMAKDHHGNWNNNTCITLTVKRRGDIVGNGMLPDNLVDMADYNRIAQYTVGLLSAPDELIAGTVPAASWDDVDMADALYIAMYTVGGYPAP